MVSKRLALALQLAAASAVFAATGDMTHDMTTGNRSDMSMMDKKVPAGTIRASTLIGTEVYNSSGKHLGEIKDVVLDSGHRQIGYVVLSYGGLAGLGDKLFALPRDLIQYSPADKRALVQVDEQVLRNAPGFDQSRWPTDAQSADYFRSTDTYYREHATMDRPALSDQDKTARPAAGRMDTDRGNSVAWNRRTSSLIGANVENANGENLGEVKDLVFDWNTGKVRYAVLSYGGILGIGDKLFAVPIDAFSPKPDSSKLILNASKDQLKNAPGFSKDNWPDMANEQWNRSVQDFYKSTRTDTDVPR